MSKEKERLIREAFKIAREIGSRGFVAKWMADAEAILKWPDPAVRAREMQAFWDKQWKASYPARVKEAHKLSLAELTAYRNRLQAELAGTSDFRKLFDHYAALGASRRAAERTQIGMKRTHQ
jgi:hypothetical protein